MKTSPTAGRSHIQAPSLVLPRHSLSHQRMMTRRLGGVVAGGLVVAAPVVLLVTLALRVRRRQRRRGGRGRRRSVAVARAEGRPRPWHGPIGACLCGRGHAEREQFVGVGIRLQGGPSTRGRFTCFGGFRLTQRPERMSMQDRSTSQLKRTSLRTNQSINLAAGAACRFSFQARALFTQQSLGYSRVALALGYDLDLRRREKKQGKPAVIHSTPMGGSGVL